MIHPWITNSLYSQTGPISSVFLSAAGLQLLLTAFPWGFTSQGNSTAAGEDPSESSEPSAGQIVGAE